MNGSASANISVIDPISPAIDRVRTILFRPFDLGKWFVIGFSAWLAQLGETGGPRGSSGPSGGSGGRGHGNPYGFDGSDVSREISHAWEYVLANLDWIVPVAIGALVFFIGIWLLFLWLNSRGRFMFLYCVAQNKAEVTNPWHRFRGHANNLFAFRAIVGILSFVAALVPIVLGGIVVSASIAAKAFTPLAIIGVVAAVMFFIAVLVVAGLIGMFTKDFVVPIMYLHASPAVQAWRFFLDVLTVNKARFFLYILFKIVIEIAVGVIVVMAMCCTCCCAACLFAIPYIGSVLMLPVHVFNRSYSLYYIAQYGPQFGVFAPTASEPAPGDQPTA